jgi:sugar-specific transcriptional regulator TrmB
MISDKISSALYEMSHRFGALEKDFDNLAGEFEEMTIPSEGVYRSNESALTNIRERLSHLEQVVVTFMSESTKQWTEERLRALEHQVKELRNAKRTEAASGRDAKNDLPGSGVAQYSDPTHEEGGTAL